jgi:predicted dehydrogenase
MNNLPLGFGRRTFIKAAAAAGAGLAFMPAASYARILGANGRINIGVIGTGGMGTSHLNSLVRRREADNILVTRVCDVYRRRLNNAAKIAVENGAPTDAAGGKGPGTMEYREVIDDRGVDAVLIATPDHWHVKMAIEAMENGKDVYVEKPLSHTIEQALACRDAVRRTKRVLQVGPQGTSADGYYKARDLIGAGRIGKVTWSQAAYCRNSTGGQFNWGIDPDAGPDAPRDSDGYVWWDRWLGHEHGLAPKIPWNADHFFRFRKYFAYNGGVATDLLYHRLAPLLIAITGMNGEYPKRVVASGGRFLEKDERDIPDTFMMMVDYPSEHTIVLASVMTNDVGLDTIIRGQHATMYFGGGSDTGNSGSLRIREQEAWHRQFRANNPDRVTVSTRKNSKGEDEVDPRPGAAEYEVKVEGRRDHMGNFFDAIRESAPLACNVELGCSTMVAIKMGVEAYRQDKVMLWDAQREVARTT